MTKDPPVIAWISLTRPQSVHTDQLEIHRLYLWPSVSRSHVEAVETELRFVSPWQSDVVISPHIPGVFDLWTTASCLPYVYNALGYVPKLPHLQVGQSQSRDKILQVSACWEGGGGVLHLSITLFLLFSPWREGGVLWLLAKAIWPFSQHWQLRHDP